MSTTPSYRTHRYLLMTVDPVHIGTGGMRLGRVDLSIAREPGTRLPKIPGTSLSGATRSYAAYRYGKRRCAGQGQPGDGRPPHCGQPTCPICYTFGFVRGEDGGQQARSGVVSIGDARLLLFPVHSMVGPVWVTSPSALQDVGIDAGEVSDDRARWPAGLTEQEHLNLGWLMLEREGDLQLDDLPEAIRAPAHERIVLVSDKLFSQVVNSNLEVRTSVSINPETGAAEEGALYTYEAIPRAAVLWIDIVVDDYREAFPSHQQLEEWQTLLAGNDEAGQKELLQRWNLWRRNGNQVDLLEAIRQALSWIEEDRSQYDRDTLPAPRRWRSERDQEDTPGDLVTAGLEWAEHLGVGGMGTRGFGRLRLLGEVGR